MKFNRKMFIFITISCLCICLLFVYRNQIENFDNKEKKNIKWGILLTTCVSTNRNDSNEVQSRKDLYDKQIKKWLDETNLPIFVVESSGHDFNELGKHDNLTILTFKQAVVGGSSQGENNSIKYALSKLKDNEKYQECTHILKVTGRYFLSGIENILNDIDPVNDLFFQIHRNDNIKFQNSEYFGMKKELFLPFVESYTSNYAMEEHLYNFSLNKKWTTIGPFKNDVPRGGDHEILQELFTNKK